MARLAPIAVLAGVMIAALPAYAQERLPELDGAPPPLQVPKSAPPKPPTPAPTQRPQPPRVASPTPAEISLKAEQDRLAQLAAELDARKTRLDAREAELAKEEDSLAADYASKLAQLDRQRVSLATPPAPPAPVAPPRYRISSDDAERACSQAAMADARDHDFYSASYDAAPRWFESQRELRGRVRMNDRRGYVLVNTVCRLDSDGDVMRFDVIR